MKYILQEITPLSGDSLYIANYWPDNRMDFPLHFHEDFELNLTLNVKGKRIAGNLVEDFNEVDLVIFFPNVIHCYKVDDEYSDVSCEVAVVQFSKDLPLWRIFSTTQLKSVCRMLSQPVPGLKFSRKVAEVEKEKILRLCSLDGFAGAALFLEILNDLATVDKSQVEVIGASDSGVKYTQSRRVNKIIQFVEKNYRRKISLDEIGQLVGMSASSVSRFFKNRTRQNFWNYLNGVRVDCASMMLIKTDSNVSEICYACGFNNLSNFNKVFREKMNCTPSEYRQRFKKSSI